MNAKGMLVLRLTHGYGDVEIGGLPPSATLEVRAHFGNQAAGAESSMDELPLRTTLPTEGSAVHVLDVPWGPDA